MTTESAFDDRSAEMAEAQGVPVVNMYRTGLQGGAPIEEEHAFAARVAGYGLDGTNFLFSHERVTFGIRDTAALRRRFMIYTNAMEAVLDRLTAGGKRVIAVQELGGSISAEHGIGTLKRRWLARDRSPAEVAAMRAVKGALDPDGVLNPGVLFE